MLFYEIFRSFGLKVVSRPAIDRLFHQMRQEHYEDGVDSDRNVVGSDSNDPGSAYNRFLREYATNPVAIGLSCNFTQWKGRYDDLDDTKTEWNKWTGKQMPERRKWNRLENERISMMLRGGDPGHGRPLVQSTGFIDGKEVYWLNNRHGHTEPQISWILRELTVVNEAEPRMTYSSLAPIAVIPKGGGAENATDFGANEAGETHHLWEQVWVTETHIPFLSGSSLVSTASMPEFDCKILGQQASRAGDRTPVFSGGQIIKWSAGSMAERLTTT
ncbi:hypothetical protein B0T14DRAFT_607682 [Immersiella caudata]|uniref:Uncharacterized protein n=1 Tax=Immersiella caudata TaxID=314043 RepID=A0AA39U4I6_9PEZI|nr:hypothetical protein B0T14DRAFT_607682 [Immersiella caudata]